MYFSRFYRTFAAKTKKRAMAETENSILQKLDGLESRFEEVSTLITDPNVIGDQQRFVKLTKEYKDLSDIMDARKRYIN